MLLSQYTDKKLFFKLLEADLQIMMNVVTNPNYICIGLCQ